MKILSILSAIMLFFIKAYQYLISPMLCASCRYHPTCSNYMLEAIKTHGPFGGLFLGVIRLCRCHPFSGSGFDPVPPLIKQK
jgi:uncharacterized protein